MTDSQSAVMALNAKNKAAYAQRNLNEDPCDENGIHWKPCYSNVCFELWLCEYFSLYQTAVSSCDDYIAHLKKIFKDNGSDYVYSKADRDLHQHLVAAGGSLQNAIRNSEQLSKNGKTSNPSMGVYHFGQYFDNYLKK